LTDYALYIRKLSARDGSDTPQQRRAERSGKEYSEQPGAKGGPPEKKVLDVDFSLCGLTSKKYMDML